MNRQLFWHTRFRLAVSYSTAIAIIFLLLLGGFFVLLRFNFLRRIEFSNHQDLTHLQPAIHTVPGLHVDLADFADRASDTRALRGSFRTDLGFQLLDARRHLVLAAGAPYPPPVRSQALGWLPGDASFQVRGIHYFRSVIPLADGAGYLEEVASIEPALQGIGAMLHLMLWAVPFVLLASLATGIWLSGAAMGPLVESLEGMKRFTSDAAHELRTPLTALRAQAELIAANPTLEVAELQRKIGTMHSEIRRLVRLSEDLLYLSRHEHLPAETRPFDLTEVLEDVVEGLSPLAEERRVAIRLLAPENQRLHGSPESLYRMFWNLIENGIKYTDEGGFVEILAEGRAGHMLRVQIRDTGIGIAEDHLPLLFERFYRGHPPGPRSHPPAERRATEGSGLGLAIVETILAAHGGKIEVTSKPGAGSTFTVHLPLD